MFVRAAFPIWQFIDPVTGLPLNDEYYVSFLKNTFPYLPSPVYVDNQGLFPWSDPLQLNSAGQLPDNLYFNPDLVYRIEVRHGPLQSDPLINLIQDFVPEGSGGITPGSTGVSSNQIINPQFAFIDFVSPLTITAAGTYDVAPGWQLVLTGSGNAIVTQVATIPNNNTPLTPLPPYFLRINLSGAWTSAILQQQFNGLGSIFTNEFVAMSVFAKTESGGTPSLTLQLKESTGPGPIEIFTGPLSAANFTVLGNSVPVPPSFNTSPNNLGFVDAQIVLPLNSITDISDVQLFGSEVLISSVALQPDQTLEQQQNALFNVYFDSITTQAKDNLLVGWNFSQNPWQFWPKAGQIAASVIQYTADQTILRQETGGAYNISQGGRGSNYSYSLTAQNGVAANRFALIQYLDYSSIQGYFGQVLSSLVRAILATSVNTQTNLKMRLIYRTAGDAIPTISSTEPITGWDGNGDLTFAAGWTALKPLNDTAYLLSGTLDPSAHEALDLPSYAFDQFQLPEAPSPGTIPYLGVVLYVTAPIHAVTGSIDIINISRVSLVPNSFAIDVSPESFDSTLRKCQFYYEKSYQIPTMPGTATDTGEKLVRASLWLDNSGGGQQLHLSSFPLEYQTIKRAIPTLRFYSPSNAANNISMRILRNGALATPTSGATNPSDIASSQWVVSNQSESRAEMIQINTAANRIETIGISPGDESILLYHYEADARAGLV